MWRDAALSKTVRKIFSSLWQSVGRERIQHFIFHLAFRVYKDQYVLTLHNMIQNMIERLIILCIQLNQSLCQYFWYNYVIIVIDR